METRGDAAVQMPPHTVQMDAQRLNSSLDSGSTEATFGVKLRQQATNRRFPTSIGLFSAGGLFEERSGVLAEYEDAPLNAVSIRMGNSGHHQSDVVLHSGASETTPPMATLNFQKHSLDFDVSLPAFVAAGSVTPMETVSCRGWRSRSYVFAVDVDCPDGVLREQFEWRRSRGDDVRQLGGRREGYKLVRLNSLDSNGPLAGDGKQVVAVCAVSKSRMDTRFQVRFLGSATAKLLGDRWAVMTVITALGLYERAMRNEESGASSG